MESFLPDGRPAGDSDGDSDDDDFGDYKAPSLPNYRSRQPAAQPKVLKFFFFLHSN